MEKRYQVFVSSTYTDLQQERQEVIRALLELDCIPAGMELFPASDDDQWTLIKRVIDDCDYYLLIIGARYGSTDEKGLSFTEREFDYALETKKPVIAFLHESPDDVVVSRAELDAEKRKALQAFREKAKKRMCKLWKTPQNLGGAVSRSYVQLIKQKPAEGWIRARHAASSEMLERMADLQARVESLQTELASARVARPEGTEQLAQGEDKFSIGYSFPQLTQYRTDAYDSAVLSWNDLFSILGPRMFDECSEKGLRDELNRQIFSFLTKKQLGRFADGASFEVEIDSKDFQTIKTQFLALGLIRKSQRKRAPSDKQTYWSLTPFGETYAVKIVAVQRAPAPTGDGG